MRPARWRRSTHVVIGVGGAAASWPPWSPWRGVVTSGGPPASERHGRDAAARARHAPSPASPRSADSAPKPTPDRLDRDARARSSPTRTSARFTGRVTDAITGAQLWAQGARTSRCSPRRQQGAHHRRRAAHARPRRTPDHHGRRRRPGRVPGLVVLKGGGDPTLSAAAPGNDDLVPATPPGSATWPTRCASRCGAVKAVQVDASAFSGPTMAPGWDPLDIDGGDIAPMESVMLDAGRTQPVSVDSRRSSTPGARRRPRARRRARRRPGVRHLACARPSPGRSRSRRCSRRR